MSLKETRILVTLISTATVFAIYQIVVLGLEADGRFAGDDGTERIAQAILILIGVQIAATIVAQIVASIVHAVATGQEEPDITDERDKLIELRALRISFFIVGVGIVGTLAAMALGTEIFWVFNLIIIAMTVGDIVGNGIRLTLYRRGF